jgi:hypothetical protein
VLFRAGCCTSPNWGTTAERVIHFSCATALLLTLAYFALFLFTKSSGSPTPQKLTRNAIYRACGIDVVVCIGLIAVYYLAFEGTAISQLQPVFWLESLALWAFGISWFVKGETIFKDPA